MKCRACQANLGQVNRAGEPLLRNRGLVFKADSVVALCPRCGGDVPFTAEITRALRRHVFIIPKKGVAA